jgi:hypothetical protein
MGLRSAEGTQGKDEHICQEQEFSLAEQWNKYLTLPVMLNDSEAS